MKSPADELPTIRETVITVDWPPTMLALSAPELSKWNPAELAHSVDPGCVRHVEPEIGATFARRSLAVDCATVTGPACRVTRPTVVEAGADPNTSASCSRDVEFGDPSTITSWYVTEEFRVMG